MSYGTSPSNSAECTIVAVAVEKNGQNMDQLQLYLVSGTGNTFKKAFTEVSFVGDISKNLTRA